MSRMASRVFSRLGLSGEGRYVVGITGPPAVGKSTLSVLLRDELNAGSVGIAQIAPMDGFHMTNAQLDAAGARHRKGEPDTFDVAGFVAALRELHEVPVGSPVLWPTYDRRIHNPTPGGVVFGDERVAVVEGNYLLLDDDVEDGSWSQVAGLLDEVWFIDADDDLIEPRLLRRQLEGGKTPEQARAKVRDSDLPNAALIRATRKHADLVLRECAGSYLVLE